VFGTTKQSGGEVHIESEIGRGTAVTVDLPRAGTMSSQTPSDWHEEPLIDTGATILLVDDDDQVRAMTAAMLQDLGYNVRNVDCGEAALMVIAEDTDIDILLTDLVMPGINGSRLAALAKARQPDLSVVFISGYADQIEGALEPGDRVIRKPFAAADLYRTIEATLGQQHGVPSSA
jgi:CheY-like chemotaxis protein